MLRTGPSTWLTCLSFALPGAAAQVTSPGWAGAQLLGHDPRPLPEVFVAPPDVASYLAEDELRGPFPLRYGALLPLQVDLLEQGRWSALPDGGRACQLEFFAPGARSIGLELDRFWLPEGGALFLYDRALQRVQGAYGAINNQPHRQIQLSPFPGERVVLEYREAAGARERAELRVGTLIYDYRDLFALEAGWAATGGLGGSGAGTPCLVDANCPEGDAFPDQKRAVTRTLSGGALCSGALINNTAQDGTQYYLTAWHCGQGSNTLFRFNYQTPNCGGSGAPTSQEVSGATVLAADQASDGRLLRVNTPIPASYAPYLMGWNRSGQTPHFAYGFSHPAGGPKKLSIASGGAVKTSTTIGGIGTIPTWTVNWTLGSILGGSSGSPLYDQSGRARGVASGAPDVECPPNTSYGRLPVFWNNTGIAAQLDPLGLGVQAIDGFDPLDPGSVTPPGLFAVESTVPDQLEVVLSEQPAALTFQGHGFEQLDEVRVNGVTLPGFPPLFAVGNDFQASLQLQSPLPLSGLTVELISGSQVVTVQVPVDFNAQPTIHLVNGDPTFLLTLLPLEVYLGGAPGDLAVLFGSLTPLPSSVPGILELQIGAGLSDLYYLEPYLVDPVLGYGKLTADLGLLPIGLRLYFQAAYLHAAAPALPLTPSNVESGTVLF
jgi:hypothetical protein